MTNDPNHYKLLKDKERKEIDIRKETHRSRIHTSIQEIYFYKIY